MRHILDIMDGDGVGEMPHLRMVYEKQQSIPNAIKYSIQRFEKVLQMNVEDTGILIYYYQPGKPNDNYLQLKFCVAGNMYCADLDCSHCSLGNYKNCEDSANSMDVIQISFSVAQLLPFGKVKTSNTLSDEVLNFRHKMSFSRTIPICSKIKSTVEGLLNHKYTGSLENIYVNAQLHMLLLFSLDYLTIDKLPKLPECRFLNNPADKEKVTRARELLIQHLCEPITIKELSRKVAMNECYLKKGFKEMYGTTIFEFYQSQRMEHAKYLLYEKAMNVTEVSLMLGYSSISHFSTAFKKQTGLKPCELLLR